MYTKYIEFKISYYFSDKKSEFWTIKSITTCKKINHQKRQWFFSPIQVPYKGKKKKVTMNNNKQKIKQIMYTCDYL
jgi:hypothetical protein